LSLTRRIAETPRTEEGTHIIKFRLDHLNMLDKHMLDNKLWRFEKLRAFLAPVL
jgi:hypothetical protein